MEYKIHKETGVADSKETILQLIDGKQLCQFKEPYQEVKVYVDMILNHISTFWDDVNDEKVLQKRIIDDEKRVLMIDPEDYTPEDRAFLTKCGGELKFEYDWDGLPEVTYNGSWPEKYNGKYYIDAGDTMVMNCFDDSGILFQITTYNMCNVAIFRTLSNEDTLKESRSLEINICHDIYDKVIALGYNAAYDKRFGDINIITPNSKYPIIRYNDIYYRCLTQLNFAHTLSEDGDILSAKMIKVYKPLFSDSNSIATELQDSLIQPSLNDYVAALQKSNERFTTLTDFEPVLTDEGKLVVNRYGSTIDFKLRNKKTKRNFALKAFTKDISRFTQKYRDIESYLSTKGSTEYLVIPKVYEKELLLKIETGTTKIPVVITPWPEGSSLYSYVMKNSCDSSAMKILVHRLSIIFVDLRNRKFAHGNLNPRNVYYNSLSYEFRLYDYDNMIIPDCKIGFLKKQDENYVFPNKITYTAQNADDFAITTILLSLKAISIDSKLLIRNNNNVLVFTKADYSNIAKSILTPSLPSLLEDSDFRSLYSIFAAVLDKGYLQSVFIEKLNINNPCIEEAKSIYQEGESLKEQGYYEESAKKYNRASFLGYYRANRHLGFLTIKSLISVSEKLRTAMALIYYKRNMRQMDNIAAFNIGVIYYWHNKIEDAVEYFKMSANWGNAIAQCNLAYFYENGIGVEKNPEIAEQYLLCASESENVIARNIVINYVFELDPYFDIIETYNG